MELGQYLVVRRLKLLRFVFSASQFSRSQKVVWYRKMDQKVCLNMVKKDQLCAIALKKRN